MAQKLLIFFSLPLLAYGVICLLFFLRQRSLLYYPDRQSMAAAEAQAAGSGLSPWKNTQGEFIGWRTPPQLHPAARWLHLHGNGGQALGRAEAMNTLLAADPAAEIFILEYPGYGPRAGTTNEASLNAAALEAMDALPVDAPIFLYGRSMGGAVAITVMTARPGRVAGAVFITPLPGFAAVGSRHYPWLPVGALLRDRLNSRLLAPALKIPAQFVIAERDGTIPADLGRDLAKAWGGRKRLLSVPGDHNDFAPDENFWRSAREFLADPKAER